MTFSNGATLKTGRQRKRSLKARRKTARFLTRALNAPNANDKVPLQSRASFEQRDQDSNKPFHPGE